MLMQSPENFTRIEQFVETDTAPQAEAFTRNGLIAGSLVETMRGWCDVADLKVGDRIGTWDGGMARLTALRHTVIRPDPSEALISVPGGALGNCSELTLMPGQKVMLTDPQAERLLGETHVLVSARALVGCRHIQFLPNPDQVDLFHLGFEDEELVYVNTGVLLHCNFGRTKTYFTALDDTLAGDLLSLVDTELPFIDRAAA